MGSGERYRTLGNCNFKRIQFGSGATRPTVLIPVDDPRVIGIKAIVFQYEDTKLVCYCKIDDGQPQRMELSDRERKELEKSKGDMVGVPGLLPDYLQDMSVSQTEDAAVFTFLLPVEDVLAETTILSVYIHNAMTLSYRDSLPENLMVVCTLEADPQTFQPRSLSYDFSQLKPYVLSEGTLSGEYALDTDCMTLVYTFDYDLPETTTIPKSMLPEEA